MNSGRSGSKGKGYRPKEPASINHKSSQDAQNSNSDRNACGGCGSSSHPVSCSGTGSAPKDPVSRIGNSAKNSSADITGSGPCVSSSDPVSSSGTEGVPGGPPPPSVWGSGKLNFPVGHHSNVAPTEEKSTSKAIAGGASQAVERSSGKSAEEPSGSVSLQPSRLDSKHKQRDESYKAHFDAKISTQVQSQGSRGNEGEGSRGRIGGRVGYQRGEIPGNEEGWNKNRGGRGGGRGGYGSQRGESDRIDALGRCLSSVLRHRAENLDLNIRSDGYVAVNDLLKLNTRTRAGVPLRSHTVDDIKEAVKRDNKQRFGLREENGVLLIRANQGHSMETVNSVMLLESIPSAEIENLSVCVHGTYLKNLESIKKNGLNRMQRNHVHFARGLPTDSGVISGMRSDCEVYIYLDVQKAIQDGMKLFVSENGVILTEGFNGVVPPKYFAKIETVDRKRNRKY